MLFLIELLPSTKVFFFFFKCSGAHGDLHSSPTRRSSDLRATRRASRLERVRVSGGGDGGLRHDRGQAIKKSGFFDGFDQIRVNASAAPGFRVEPKTQR